MELPMLFGKVHRVVRSSGEQKANHLIRSSFENSRTGVSSFTKWCPAKTTDSDLIGESYVANFVRQADVVKHTGNPPGTIRRGSPEFVDGHIPRGDGSPVRRADEK